MKLLFITDPLITSAGAVRPALLLAKQLHLWGYSVEIASPQFAEETVKTLELEGLQHSQVGPSFSLIKSFPTLDAWARGLVKPTRMIQRALLTSSQIDFSIAQSGSLPSILLTKHWKKWIMFL